MQKSKINKKTELVQFRLSKAEHADFCKFSKEETDHATLQETARTALRFYRTIKRKINQTGYEKMCLMKEGDDKSLRFEYPFL